MRNKNRLIGALAGLLVAIFLAGVVELFQLRFSAGDVYPPYSSFRADPLGAKALYESLEKVPGVTVARHMKPLAMLAGSGVFIYAGLNPLALRAASDKDLERYEAVVKRGGRLILALQPVTSAIDATPEVPAIEKRWGAALTYPPRRKAAEEEGEIDEMPRHTLVYFDRLDKNWRMLQKTGGHATVIERSMGAGSIVLVANGYLLSNEALLANRDSALLAAIIGAQAQHITFDEHHFGIEETGSLAALARKYGLHGLVAGVLLLAALFVWQSSAGFLPPREVEETEVLGKSAVSGFVNLLRRGVSSAELLPLCAKEWRKVSARDAFCSIDKRKRIEEVIAGGAGDPLAAYRRISRILAERKLQ